MDGIAFNWKTSVVCRSALAWIRPRRLLARLDAIAALSALMAVCLLLSLRVAESPLARLAHVVFEVLIAAVMLALLYRDGQYAAHRRMSRLADLAALIKNAAFAFFIVCGVWLASDGFFTGFRDSSRLLVFSGVLILAGLLGLNRLVLFWYQRRLFSKGEGMREVILIGEGKVARDFARFLGDRPWLGVRCAGTMPARGTRSVERVREMLRSGRPCELIVALEPEEHAEFDRVTVALHRAGIPFCVVPALFEESLHAARVYGFREPPVFNVNVNPLDQVKCAFKRTLDVSVSALALLLLSPVLVAIAAAIRLDSRGPVVFRQTRLGSGGRPFEILKFRTMVANAESLLENLKSRDEGRGPHFKMRHDPRVTRLGSFLRKWSLDELLQFANVLRGDMSLVGPRPPLPREVDKYETPHLVRLKGKPGITGLWQISGRKDLTFDDMVRLDRHYLENWSIGMDLGIILRTVSVVLAHRGAY